MRFLLTNDDGIHAPGLAALEAALAEMGEITVVAPHEELSGCAHQITLHRPLTLTEVGQNRHMVDGLPVDCTRIGLIHLGVEADWVISGINHGSNLGVDVFRSGTVAAVREAALMGKPGIAVSQYRDMRRGGHVDWDKAARWTGEIVSQLAQRDQVQGRFWNVNLPDVELENGLPEVVFCGLDLNPLPIGFLHNEGKLEYHGVYRDRKRHAGRDVETCLSGRISITEVRLDGGG